MMDIVERLEANRARLVELDKEIAALTAQIRICDAIVAMALGAISAIIVIMFV